jgi:hypothetical protein
VVDQGGRPVADAWVRCVAPKNGDLGEGPTADDGSFRCTSMRGAADYLCAVYPQEGVRQAYPTVDGKPHPAIHVADGAAVITGVRLAIRRDHLEIAGRVIDTSGAPVLDARVRAVAMRDDGQPPQFPSWRPIPLAITDTEGAFRLAGLAPGTYAVEARGADGGEKVVTGIAAGARDVDIVIERPGAIEGDLVGFANPPVVYASPIGSTFRLNGGSIDGVRFRVPGVPQGRYLVTAQNALEGDIREVQVRVGETARVTLTSQGSSHVDVMLTDFETGKPIPGATCRTILSTEGRYGVTNWDPSILPRTDETGRVSLESPAGTVAVQCFGSPRMAGGFAEVVAPRGGRVAVEVKSVFYPEGDPSYGDPGFTCDWWVIPPIVNAVAPGGPAATGVTPGDRVVSLDGVSLAGLSCGPVTALLTKHPPGTTVKLGLARGDSVRVISLTLGTLRGD